MKKRREKLLQAFGLSLSAMFFLQSPMQIMAQESLPEPYEGRNEYQPEEQTALTEEEMQALVSSLQEKYRVEAPEPIETEPQEAPQVFALFSFGARNTEETPDEETGESTEEIIDTSFHIYPQIVKNGRRYGVSEIHAGGLLENAESIESIEYWLDGTEEKYTATPLETPLENGDNWTGASPISGLETGKLYRFVVEYHEKEDADGEELMTMSLDSVSGNEITVEESESDSGETSDDETVSGNDITVSENAIALASEPVTVSENKTPDTEETVSENTIFPSDETDTETESVSANTVSVSGNTVSANTLSVSANEIPAGTKYSDSFYLYEVQRGDKLRTIAEHFGISVNTITTDN